MKLHNQKSYIRTQHEGVAPSRTAPRITQIIYILFILFLFIYLIYFFASRAFFVQTEGLIEREKVDLGAIHGGPIASMNPEVGGLFKQGDVLAIVGPSKFCQAPEPDLRPQRLAYEIEDETIKLNGMRRELDLLEQSNNALNIEPGSVKRALEINAPLLDVKKDRSKLQVDIERQHNAIKSQQQIIATLTSRLQLLRTNIRAIEENPACGSHPIIAPFDGEVFSITLQRDEVANRGDVVLTVIPDNGTVSTELYLSAEEYADIRETVEFVVTLPDGSETKGLVTGVESSAVVTPDRKLDGYRPLRPGIRVSLSAEDSATTEQWKKFDRYQVSVKGRK